MKKTSNDELDLATEEFVETFKAFEKAAKKLTAVMQNVNRNRLQKLKDLSRQTGWKRGLLIQMTDDQGRVVKKHFNLVCEKPESSDRYTKENRKNPAEL